jgi:hypothetical protein
VSLGSLIVGLGLSHCCCTFESHEQRTEPGDRPAFARAGFSRPGPPPHQDIVDIYTDPALIGTDKRNDTKPVETRVVRPQGNIETR